jgi:hypothetical protein
MQDSSCINPVHPRNPINPYPDPGSFSRAGIFYLVKSRFAKQNLETIKPPWDCLFLDQDLED